MTPDSSLGSRQSLIGTPEPAAPVKELSANVSPLFGAHHLSIGNEDLKPMIAANQSLSFDESFSDMDRTARRKMSYTPENDSSPSLFATFNPNRFCFPRQFEPVLDHSVALTRGTPRAFPVNHQEGNGEGVE